MTASISRPELIRKLEELDTPERVERSLRAALGRLGWEDKQVFASHEMIRLGTVLAEDAQAELAASSDPADRAKAEALGPYIEAMRAQVLPHLGNEGQERP